MNLRQLDYFTRIAELQSFTRAASVLHVAQPSLSRQMQQLEQELGVLLFVRSDKGIKLTEAGLALQERANAVLRQVKRIRDEIGVHTRTPKGELSVGLPPSLFDLLTVPLVCEFRRRYPDVQLRITEGISAAMHEMVLTGKLDTAVISDVEPLELLRSKPLLREQLYLIAPADSGLQQGEGELPVSALAARPLVLTSRPNALRMIVERALTGIGQEVVPVAEANSTRLLTELVANGIGSTVLSYSAISTMLRTGRVVAAPLHDLSVTWTSVTSRERGISLTARKLRETLVEIVRAQIADGRWHGVVVLD